MITLRWLTLISAAAVLSGCSYLMGAVMGPTKMYAGPDRPASEISTIEEGGGVVVRSVNGEAVPAFNSPILHVLPGEETLLVHYTEKYSNAAGESVAWNDFRVSFRAEPGRRYKVMGGSIAIGRGLCVGVKDVEADKIVAATGIPCSSY